MKVKKNKQKKDKEIGGKERKGKIKALDDVRVIKVNEIKSMIIHDKYEM